MHDNPQVYFSLTSFTKISLVFNRGTNTGSEEDIWKMGESFSSESKNDVDIMIPQLSCRVQFVEV